MDPWPRGSPFTVTLPRTSARCSHVQSISDAASKTQHTEIASNSVRKLN
jgi:hypothetical protein